MTTGTNNRGMIPIGTFTVAIIKADHISAVPTAIIYGATEGVDAPRALRDFCQAYSAAKGAVAIVQAFGGGEEKSDSAKAVAKSDDDRDVLCVVGPCVRGSAHDDEHRDVQGRPLDRLGDIIAGARSS